MISCVKMHLGDELVDIDVPASNVLAIIGPNEVKGASSEKAEVERALDSPVCHGGIGTLAKRNGKVVVVVDDNTRPTPVHRILPILLDRLNKARIGDRNVSVLIALGTHRMVTDNEIREKIGKETFERVSVTNHYWKQKEMLIDMGKTPSGVPLSVSKNYLEASVRIGVGHSPTLPSRMDRGQRQYSAVYAEPKQQTTLIG
jgi:nickel-dependent lactate racemase